MFATIPRMTRPHWGGPDQVAKRAAFEPLYRTTQGRLIFVAAVLLILALNRVNDLEMQTRTPERPPDEMLAPVIPPDPVLPSPASVALELHSVAADQTTREVRSAVRSGDPLILFLRFEGAHPGTALVLRWVTVQGQSQTIVSHGAIVLPSDSGEISFRSNPPPGGWKTGKHMIELLDASRTVAVKEFTVRR